MRLGKRERRVLLKAKRDAVQERTARVVDNGGYYRSVYSKLTPTGKSSKKWGNADRRKDGPCYQYFPV